MRAPSDPTAREVEEQSVSHLPCRAWCQECVRGRGKSLAHKNIESAQAATVETIGTDYLFL
eukprot:15149093-Heterocapsa_arctica.AAC.1